MFKNYDAEVMFYLHHNGESSCLDIFDYLEEKGEKMIFVELYPSLNRLEKKGFIKSRYEEKNPPRQKYYSIQEK
jgi:DNA-binding PadR family transcriptional regulator